MKQMYTSLVPYITRQMTTEQFDFRNKNLLQELVYFSKRLFQGFHLFSNKLFYHLLYFRNKKLLQDLLYFRKKTVSGITLFQQQTIPELLYYSNKKFQNCFISVTNWSSTCLTLVTNY